MSTQARLTRFALAIAALTLMSATATLQAQTLRPSLSLATAKKIAQGCEDRARKEGWNLNIAIVDEGGNLKHFTSMDNAFLATAKIAQLKAQTSVGLPFPTRQVREAAKGAQGLEHTPGLILVAGGLPIRMADG